MASLETDNTEFDDEFGAVESDEFGGRKARRRRRRARRRRRRRKFKRFAKKGVKKLKKVKKVLKPLKSIVKSSIFKTIVSYIPVYGPTVVAAIEAGEAIAKPARKAIALAQKAVDKAKSLPKGSAARKKAVAAARRATERAKRETVQLAKVKKTEAGMAKTLVAKAKRGDRKARAIVGVVKARRSGNRAALSAAKRRAAAVGVKTTGDLSKAAERRVKARVSPRRRRRPAGTKPAAGKVVVLVGKRKYNFDRNRLRRMIRSRRGR